MGSVVSGGGHHEVNFYDVISLENLLLAWRQFSRGKRSNSAVAKFELRLEEHIFSLYERLMRGEWVNDPYVCRLISDPKPRIIHIASVRDRVLFQAVYQILYQIFDKTFIHDSFASRKYKGAHAGVKRFEIFVRKASANYTRNAFVLKCDVKKFFDNIDHSVLFSLISKRITDEKLLALIHVIISSFYTVLGKGLPLGNVTSQLFANIYLNELDQFVKHELKEEYYIRYCDDFAILGGGAIVLETLVGKISDFLGRKLLLKLHPSKVIIRKLRRGIDFLGYVSLPHYRILRTTTKRRMFARVCRINLPSYLGMLQYCKGWRISKRLGKILNC